MGRTWMHGTLFTPEYINGVKEFMSFINGKFSEDENILCPCSRCLNQNYHHQAIVEKHILMNGMDSTYTRWVHHGEDYDAPENENSVDVHDDGFIYGISVSEDGNADRFEGLLEDLHMAEQVGNLDGEAEDGTNDADPHVKESFFTNVMKEAKRQLYPGCTKFSKFSFVVKLLHMKSFYRISNTAFTAMLKLLADAFPDCNTVPKSYNDAKNLLKVLGLGYDSIHVCPNNCVLFRKQHAKLHNCPVCGSSRWKDPERKKVPQKVLRHFPLAPRLQRMFISKEASKEAQWHKLKRQPREKEMSHPSDGEAWQAFDRDYPDFAEDPRNIRLGLATDGFNPFGNMNTKYSMWPVFVVPYNLPPWACMEESNFMMALLIPGPSAPGKDFDVFLEPLVEDLLELWKGVRTYDADSGKMFNLRAAVLWCIHDYPALSTLSGRTTRGYFACIHCDKNPLSYALRNKIGYIGHYRFLPMGHRLRRNNEYAGLHESNEMPGKFSKEELLQELDKVRHIRPGKQRKEPKQPGSMKRKRSDIDKDKTIWKRRVSLWNLEYWENLLLRHNLDVMHIEKNICEALLATILSIAGKTKDTAKSRLDLSDLGIKHELQLRDEGNTCVMPHARFTLSKEQKVAFMDFLREVKFPDGYASNISRCLGVDGTKPHGLKTHDCHIILQRLLAAGMRGLLDKDIYEAIADLGKFFRELCSKVLNKDVLARLKDEIPIILMKLEKIFPPAFFDVMVHLAVHLPDEALLRGPVQYGWMYPIERRLCTLKRYVRNKARPEGSIAEAYVADECLTFCSKYMDDTETRFNRQPRNQGFSNEQAYDVDVFGHGVNFTSASKLVHDESVFDQMVWYVLNNCSQVDKYVKLFKDELERDQVPITERTLRQGFQNWFRNHVMKLRTDGEVVDDDLFSLACGPDFRVRKYSSCIVNGVRFNTVDREKNRRTQNSGVITKSTHNNIATDFYGTLQEIIQLDYDGHERSVVLFKCDWFKLNGKRTELKDDGYYKSINTTSLWYKKDSFILATQARKVFYIPDTKNGKNWQIVQTFDHRHLYNVLESEGALSNAPAYQDDACSEVECGRKEVSELTSEQPLNRENEQGTILDAAEVAILRDQEDNQVFESDSDSEPDDTLMAYCSENEIETEVDSDDE